MEPDNVRKKMYIFMCDWVPLLYSRKLTEHCKPTIMEKKNHLKKTKIKIDQWSFYMIQQVKDPALSRQWLGSLLWRRFDP